ncbi:MAG: putative L-carnitine dehydrogenase [Chloroflexi bacterium]|jgi:formyl-CoA transferase|nr:putative L-carnitine dehydrogenase [Chloroflexota bacterium]
MSENLQKRPPALAGIRVLDLSRILAGPYCTQLLGDLGADIIKVEQPELGDGSRAWGPPSAGGEAAYYLCLNRNKRSMTLNLKSEEGRAIIRKLAARSDILIENFKYGELERLGLSYESLAAENPGLIFCTISSYGPTGPLKERPGFDFMIQAQSGIMSITGSPQNGPTKVGVAVVDVTTGLYAANVVQAALFARERDPLKRGQKLEVSLYECALAWLANIASNYLISGKTPGLIGNAHPNVVPYQPFETADIPVVLAIGTDAQFRRYCKLVDRPELGTDPRFATNTARVMNREILIPLMQALFIQRPSAEWEELLAALDIPVGTIKTLDKVFDDPQTQALKIVHEIQHPTAGSIKLVGSPMHLSETPTQINYAPPLLGQHTAELLEEVLGYSAGEISRLRDEAVI